MSDFLVRCPECAAAIVRAPSFDSPAVRAIQFCPSCGFHLHHACPACAASFSGFHRFCPECGRCVHRSSGGMPNSLKATDVADALATLRARDSASADILAEMMQTAEVMALFVKHGLLVLLRRNPITRCAQHFCERMDRLPPAAPRQQYVTLLEEALEPAHELAHDALTEWRTNMGLVFFDCIFSSTDSLDASELEWRQHVTHRYLLDPAESAEEVALRVEHFITTALPDAIESLRHYKQLSEFFPRYKALMGESGWLSESIGYGAGMTGRIIGGLLGGHVGEAVGGSVANAGVRLWDDWINKDDRQFLQAFQMAAEQFQQTSASFLKVLEVEARPLIDQFLFEYQAAAHQEIGFLASSVITGQSLAKWFYYKEVNTLTYADHDEEFREFGEAVMVSLRSEKLTYESERRIRKAIGLPWGTS